MQAPSSDSIRFWLGNKQITLESFSPTLTLLNYLRDEQRLTGTKEGCAEGDCGACTVVLAELNGNSVSFRAVNACILFVSMLDGKQVFTVEHLKQADQLHPVQQAFVNTHASQCGFCTPGFVMSAYAMYENLSGQESSGSQIKDLTSTETINQTFAGNLCRCTGYGPIIESGKMIAETALQAENKADHSWLIERLRSIQPHTSKTLSTQNQTVFQPDSLDALKTVLQDAPEAHIVAGATDLGLWVTKQHKHLETLVLLGQVPELKTIESVDGFLEIGAAVTYSEAMPVLDQYFPEMQGYVQRHSSTQIRNSGTILGNIANGSPIGDMPPPLIALGSELLISSAQGLRAIPLEDYFISYGQQDLKPSEFLHKLRIPLQAGKQFKVYKISKRFEQDISAVSAAFALEINDGIISSARICYGGMAATPLRAKQTEAFLEGKPWDESLIDQACSKIGDDYNPISDFRASSQYRISVAKNLMRKYLIEQLSASASQNLAIQILHTGEIKHV